MLFRDQLDQLVDSGVRFSKDYPMKQIGNRVSQEVCEKKTKIKSAHSASHLNFFKCDEQCQYLRYAATVG